MSTSSDDMPAWMKQQAVRDTSPLPDWLQTGPSQVAVRYMDSSEDEEQLSAGPTQAPATQEPTEDVPRPTKKAKLDPGAQPKAVVGAAAIAPGSRASEVAVMLPEKLPNNKFLVELQQADLAATDLSGDAGAVGRMLVTGKPGEQQLKLDLKGVVYSAALLPLSSTLMVVNLGAGDAKVECILNEYIRLKEESNMYRDVPEGALGDVMDSEDENYAGPSASQPLGFKDKRSGQPQIKPPAGKAAKSRSRKPTAGRGKGATVGKKPVKPPAAGRGRGKAAAKEVAPAAPGSASKPRPKKRAQSSSDEESEDEGSDLIDTVSESK